MAATEEEILDRPRRDRQRGAGIPAEAVALDKSFTDDLDIDSLSMVRSSSPPKRGSTSRSPTTRSRTSRPSATPSTYIPAHQG